MKRPLHELAKVLRSKNSGPFAITLDVLFDDPAIYQAVKRSGVLTAQRIAPLYGIGVDSIEHLVFYDQALGVKITFSRPVSSGSALDTDVYGAQQHAPLMFLMVEMDG